MSILLFKVIIGLSLLFIIFALIKGFWGRVSKEYKYYKFWQIVSFIYVSILVMSTIAYLFDFFYFPIRYLAGISLVFYTTIAFAQIVRNIKERYLSEDDNKKNITEVEFMIYLSSFSILVFVYIISYSVFYMNALPFSDRFVEGYLIQDNKPIVLNFYHAFRYSVANFFAMDYYNIYASGFLYIIFLSELFVAQIAIIMFIGVLASMLIKMLKLQPR